MTDNIYSWRLPLVSTEGNIALLEYDKDFIKIDNEERLMGGIYITRKHEDMMVLPSCNSLETVEMMLGNGKEEYAYALIAFCNWEQVSFEDGDIVKYVKPPANTCVYKKITVPKVESNTPYQIIAYPKPFGDELNYTSSPMSTLRTIIKPSNAID